MRSWAASALAGALLARLKIDLYPSLLASELIEAVAVLRGCGERVSAGPNSLISGKIQGISANVGE